MSKGKKDVFGHSDKVGKNHVSDYVLLAILVLAVLGVLYGVTLKSLYDEAVVVVNGFRDAAIAELQR